MKASIIFIGMMMAALAWGAGTNFVPVQVDVDTGEMSYSPDGTITNTEFKAINVSTGVYNEIVATNLYATNVNIHTATINTSDTDRATFTHSPKINDALIMTRYQITKHTLATNIYPIAGTYMIVPYTNLEFQTVCGNAYYNPTNYTYYPNQTDPVMVDARLQLTAKTKDTQIALVLYKNGTQFVELDRVNTSIGNQHCVIGRPTPIIPSSTNDYFQVYIWTDSLDVETITAGTNNWFYGRCMYSREF